jgi:hypothetical protein
MQMRVLAVLAGITLAAAAAAQATGTRGTVHGVVMRGPVAPVCVVEQPCDIPAKNVTLVFSRSRQVVARTVTGADGRYRLRLPGGTYVVRRASVSGRDRRLEPTQVVVRPGLAVRIDFHIDTGIR